MAKKHMKRCSTSLVFREMQIQATRQQYTTRMVKMKRCDSTKCRQARGGHFVVQLLSCVDSSQPRDCSPLAPLSLRFPRQEYWSGYGGHMALHIWRFCIHRFNQPWNKNIKKKIQTAPKDKLEFATQQQIFMQHLHHIYNYLHTACIYV